MWDRWQQGDVGCQGEALVVSDSESPALYIPQS